MNRSADAPVRGRSRLTVDRVIAWTSALAGAAGLAILAFALAGPQMGAAAQEGTDTASASGQSERSEQEEASPSTADGESASESDTSDPPSADALSGIAALASPWWVAETAEKYGVPERAVAAYAGAELRLASEQPGCGIDWATLAGIGHVESAHGTIDGGAIDELGQQRPALVGIALNGSRTAVIHDTDGGELDGDATWDRAVGPMQIIPSTWQQHRADGNDDGIFDPQQIDDAALAAARYLCFDGANLATADGWIAAVAAYNDTVDYNNRVAAATSYYRQ